MLEFVRVAAAASLPPGTGRTVWARGREFALFNLDGQFFALDDRCPHRGASLGAGFVEGGTVYCPMHGWAFDAKSGACQSNPERPARAFPTRVRDGEVEIGLESV
jgi:nitrite reductase (NADH) small subunit/3-phenylpropionate/trans-cinnamate dioxygenase ferredoxin subunit